MLHHIAGEAYEVTRHREADRESFRLQKCGSEATWVVQVGPDWRQCDCPDYRYRRRHAGESCKHLNYCLSIFNEEPMSTQPEEHLPAVVQRLLTLDEAMKLGEVLFRSGYFVDVRSAAQAVVKILAGQELGFGPIASLVDIHMIEGKPSVGAHLRAAAIKRSHRYHYVVLQADKTACEIEFFEGTESLGRIRVTKEEMVDQGIAIGRDGKMKMNWSRSPDDMLFARVISKGYRRFCPDLTSGVLAYDPDEIEPAAAIPENGVLTTNGSQPALPPSALAGNGTHGAPAIAQPVRTIGEIKDAIDALSIELQIPATDFIMRVADLYGTPDVHGLTETQLLDLETRLLAEKRRRQPVQANN